MAKGLKVSINDYVFLDGISTKFLVASNKNVPEKTFHCPKKGKLALIRLKYAQEQMDLGNCYFYQNL